MLTTAFEPTAQDHKLIDEAIRRIGRSLPLTDRHRGLLLEALPAELERGRRDLFSLVRAGRKAIEQA